MEVLLVGNPNCGKTTLFNALTGQNQKIGNWPGVTVEKRRGALQNQGQDIYMTDLPGLYSLSLATQNAGQDEIIAAKALIEPNIDLILNVVDACYLERHLYLTSQLLELGKPMILAINMADIAEQMGIQIDCQKLSNELGCPVILTQAHKHIGLDEVKSALISQVPKPHPLKLSIPSELKQAMAAFEELLRSEHHYASYASYASKRTLEGDTLLLDQSFDKSRAFKDADILMADARYEAVHALIESVQTKPSDASEHFTAKLDRIVLNRFFAFPIFLGIMYLMFLFAINIGGVFQGFIDSVTETLFVESPAALLNTLHTPDWLVALIAHGVGKGINTTLTFIPVILGMYFFLSFLELSGYMARAAFIMDKLMRFLGLPGKAFVPMIVGFGCNVPGIMAARTLHSEKDRTLTILMSPFMSCSARLAIYAVFVAAFFPKGGQNIVFSLYIIGILMAVLTGLMLRKTLLTGVTDALVIELPNYHKPALGRIVREATTRLKFFVLRAGKIIIPVSALLGGLDAIVVGKDQLSLLAYLGQGLTPLFSPMGITPENWPATVGLLTGMLAKEVVVGSLNTLYSQSSELIQPTLATLSLWGSLQEALGSLWDNFLQLGHALVNPLIASAPENEVSQGFYGVMAAKFDGGIGAFAYLLFVLLYMPCISTVAAIRQEASRQWMWFSLVWSTLIAYACAVIFYQVSTFALHPKLSVAWVVALSLLVIGFVMGLSLRSKKGGRQHAAQGA